jgi:4-hydroxy-tetrahydrodipicolinate synthase
MPPPPTPRPPRAPTQTPLKNPALAGVFTAVVTPFNDDATTIDFGRLKAQLEFQARGEGAPPDAAGAQGVHGVVLAGTTGEAPTLTDAEFRLLAARGVDIARRLGLRAVVGTGSNSTAHAVELQRFARSVGADAALSVNPYYNKPTQEGLYRHFMAQADAADLPLVLYNIPGRTGVALAPATVERLAAHPHVQAIKEATGSTDSCADIAARCPGLAVLSGDDAMTLPFMSVGAVGVVSVVSNLRPALVRRMVGAFAGGDHAEALRLHRAMLPLVRALFAETNPIPVKAALHLLGRDSGALRLPLTRAEARTLELLRDALGLSTPSPLVHQPAATG